MDYIGYLTQHSQDGKWETEEKRNFFLAECPFNGCSRLSVSAEKGAWRCWACGESGSFHGLCQALGLDTPGTRESQGKILNYTCPGKDTALPYLMSRGVDAAGDAAQVGYEDGYIIFPYFSQSGQVTGLKKKNLSDSGPKYLVEPGGNLGLYIPDAELFRESKSVYITEGEVDALTFLEMNKNGVALGGASHNPPPELDKFDTVYICMDSDEAGRKAADRLLQRFKHKAVVLDLPYKDPNEWWQAGGSEAELEKIVQRGRTYSSGLVKRAGNYLESTFSFLSNPDQVAGLSTGFTGLDKLLGGGRRKGEVTVYHAEAKTGKNTIWHNMIHKMFPVPVGYASRELSPDLDVLPDIFSIEFKTNFRKHFTPELKNKAQRVAAEWPLFFADGYGVFPIADLENWVRECHALGIEYFFIDHLHYCLEDEDFKLAGKFIRALKTLAKSLHVHIDLIVQPTKLPDDRDISRHTIKGGSSIEQAIDNLFLLSRVPEHRNITRLKLDFARSKMATLGEVYFKYNPQTTEIIEVTPVAEKSREEVGIKRLG